MIYIMNQHVWKMFIYLKNIFMKFYEINLLTGVNRMWHVGIGVVKNVFKISLNGKFYFLISRSIFLFFFRKETLASIGRAGNAADIEQELTEFQTTYEVCRRWNSWIYWRLFFRFRFRSMDFHFKCRIVLLKQ